MKTRPLACTSALLTLCAGLSLACSEGSGDSSGAQGRQSAARSVPAASAAPATPVAPSKPAASTVAPPFFTSLYAPPPPPVPPSAFVQALDFTFWTGGDDLRGGNDNAYVTVLLNDGRAARASINDGFRLADHTPRNTRVEIPGGTARGSIAAFEVCGTMSGGFNGDNWNIDGIRVNALSQTIGSRQIFDRWNRTPYLVRLTGDQRCARFNL